ncbi:hypothetical protein Esti_006486 [Eimeria stiedai]
MTLEPRRGAQRASGRGGGRRLPCGALLLLLALSQCVFSLVLGWRGGQLSRGGPHQARLLQPMTQAWAPFGIAALSSGFVQLGGSRAEDEREEEEEGGGSEAESASASESEGEGRPRAPGKRGGGGGAHDTQEEEEMGVGDSPAETEEEEEEALKPKRKAAAGAAAGAPEEGGEQQQPAAEKKGGGAPSGAPFSGLGGLAAGPAPPPPPMSEFLPQLSYADGEELCHSISCGKISSGASAGLPIKGCKKSIKCSKCKAGGTPEAKCLSWKPPRQPELLLRNGTYYGLKKISRWGSLDLAIKWDHENTEIDFSQCLLDVKQATLANRELNETGNVRPFAFHRMAQLTLAIVRTPEEGAEASSTPKLSFLFKLNDGMGITRAFSTVSKPLITPACYQSEQRSNVFSFGPEEASFVTGLSCPIASAQIEKEVHLAEDAMQHPVGEVPPLLAAAGAAPASAAAAAAAGAAAAAEGNPLLQRQLLQQQMLLQQRQAALKQLQFRGRHGFGYPTWRGAAGSGPSGSYGLLAIAIAAPLLPFF